MAMKDIESFYEEQEKLIRSANEHLVQTVCDKLKAGLVNSEADVCLTVARKLGVKPEVLQAGYQLATETLAELMNQLMAQVKENQ